MIDCSKATREELIQAVELLTKKYNQASEELKKYRWIPVSESPKESTDCLLSDGDDITIAFYSKRKNHFYSGDDIEPCATHWMLLPEPPEVE